HLAYAGPYSIGMVCNSANSFVEPLLDKLVRGETVRPKGLLAVGCYCPWQAKR
ncbi:thiol-disulfide isomerase, partial [Mesorhizobium sp. M2D.F.Ca.ET.153.01.1.1]